VLRSSLAGVGLLLQHLSPSLGVEVAYRDYGTDCALYR